MNILRFSRFPAFKALKPFNSLSIQQISSFSTLAPAGFVGSSIGSAVAARGGLYKSLFLIASINIVSLIILTNFSDEIQKISIQDYLKCDQIKNNQNFQLIGILKQGSVKVKRGTLQTEFVMTDFEDEIQVAYRGVSKFEFKEGEDLVLTGYCPNIEDKSFVVGIDYLTKHSLQNENWETKKGKERNNYGLAVREQSI